MGMAAIRQLLRSTLATALPRRWFAVNGPARANSICITFDDGPHPEHTPRVLDALKEAGAVATFFVLGAQVERHPDIVRRIAAEGHALGHHSFTHSPPPETSARQLLDEVQRTRDLLCSLVGQAPVLFRPPHGKLTVRKLAGLWRAGLSVVLWNVDPRDYARRSEDEVRVWFRTHPPRAGDIVLLHDTQPHTPGVVGDLVALARERRLALTTPLNWDRAAPLDRRS
jgi:peptidoglycan/xylan/chitin deacetylase (PgdA/CDA1 family)